MDIIEKEINVKSYITKSNLPASDFVINPYIGCSHTCKYCYACFMKRFTRHSEPWGTISNIKNHEKLVKEKNQNITKAVNNNYRLSFK